MMRISALPSLAVRNRISTANCALEKSTNNPLLKNDSLNNPKCTYNYADVSIFETSVSFMGFSSHHLPTPGEELYYSVYPKEENRFKFNKSGKNNNGKKALVRENNKLKEQNGRNKVLHSNELGKSFSAKA